jgi:disulfide oxidoreductase YuzD
MKFISFKDWLNEEVWNKDIMGTSFKGKGKIEANVGELVKFIKNGKYPIKDYNVKELYDLGFGKHISDPNYLKTVNIFDKKTNKWVKFYDLPEEKQKAQIEIFKKRIMKSNLKYPLLVAEDDGKPGALVDGNHRLEKAYLTKQAMIKGYVIPWNDLYKKFGKK